MNKIFLIPLSALIVVALALWAGNPQAQEKPMDTATHYELATLAGGCFWCVESDLEKVPGVLEVISGYSGGQVKNPSYEEVSSGTTGHLESVQVKFDPAVVSYAQVLDAFWRHIDPTDARGSFVDRGQQYTSAIFVHNAEQRRIAEASKKALAESGVFSSPIVTPIRDFEAFYPAEDYHQDYYKTHPLKYRFYRYNSGRDSFSDEHWKGHDAPLMLEQPMANAAPWDNFTLPDDAELKQHLTPLQYDVTQHEGTEAPFDNTYWDNKKPGIYVDIVSGEPLFSSTHKYKSGTGWPSFWQPLVPENIVTRQDNKLFTTRTEVRSKHADSHLGHVFNDGPQPTGLRYCMNSAALRFIPAEQLQAQGYGQFAQMFE